jgi:hypothetical protein
MGRSRQKHECKPLSGAMLIEVFFRSFSKEYGDGEWKYLFLKIRAACVKVCRRFVFDITRMMAQVWRKRHGLLFLIKRR